MNKKINVLIMVIVMIVSNFLTGCARVEDLKVKLGMKNKDFEYINEGRISKITIQNKRDKGYTFIITDKDAIKELYDILSKAKEVENKITLEPDYILEFQEGVNKVHKFNYVAGLDKKDLGNLYGDDKIYVVSKRLDDDIMKNFWNIRKPNKFNEVYYTSMLKAIEDYRKTVGKDKKIGIDINDEEVAKFILTMDIEEFKEKLGNNEEIITNGDRNKYDITMDIETQGYKTDIYKCIITFYDKETKKETKYYFVNKYELNYWKFNFTKDKKPKNF
ncbi:MAG: Lipoprotein [Clostridium sp.]